MYDAHKHKENLSIQSEIEIDGMMGKILIDLVATLIALKLPHM